MVAPSDAIVDSLRCVVVSGSGVTWNGTLIDPPEAGLAVVSPSASGRAGGTFVSQRAT